ncbi:uncharacterized protein LOC107485507 [Arachis duranensis]|uniref:Uncharacterized protein LOC107485507 n=1 Tax=Arachis duranensis TaxID=130453 RepID=A0A6P4D686_ARADU|nr:uncharacterized protein LOC107485507 [Arachis duranensis]
MNGGSLGGGKLQRECNFDLNVEVCEDVKETCINVANGNGIYEANVISGKMGQLQGDMTNLNQRSMEVDDVRSDLNEVFKDSTPEDVPVIVISGHEQFKIFQAKLQLPSSSENLNSDDVPVLEVFFIYACLRSFSTLLFLSPFELEDLIAALKSKTPSILFDSIHVSILKTLKKHLEYLSNEGIQFASNYLRNLNWNFLDIFT